MKLSIVIPTTNQFDAINKIAEQYTSSESEVIVAGQGKYENARTAISNSSSINELRKLGVQAAKGEYIYLIDRDDEIIMSLKEMLSHLEKDIVIFTAKSGKKVIKKFKSEKQSLENNWAFWNIIAINPLYNKVKFPDLKNTQDLVPVQMLLNSSVDIKFVDKPIYDYKINAGSIQSKLNNFDDGYKAIDILKKEGVSNRVASSKVSRIVLIKSIIKSKQDYKNTKRQYSTFRKNNVIKYDLITLPMPFFARKIIVNILLKLSGMHRWKKEGK